MASTLITIPPSSPLDTQMSFSGMSHVTKQAEPLDRDNWVAWHRRLLTSVSSVSTFEDIILNRLPCPVMDNVREEDREKQSQRIVEWQRRDAFLRSAIMGNVSSEIINAIPVELITANEHWDHLQEYRRGTTTYDFIHLFSLLNSTKYVDGEDIRDHIAKMQDYRNQVVCLNDDAFKVPELIYACILRLSMPKSWDIAFTGLPNNLRWKEIVRRINDESAKRMVRQSAEDQAEAAYNLRHGKQKSKRSGAESSSGDSAKKCTNCGKSNHWFQDCWAPGGGAEGQGPRQSSSRSSRSSTSRRSRKGRDRAHKARSVASSSRGSDSDSGTATDGTFLAIDTSDLAFATANTPADTFYRDSGATCHICTNRALFTKYITLDTPSRIGGIKDDGEPLLCYGIGEIILHFPLPDNQSKLIKLKNVRYAPNASINVVSESRMDDSGCTITVRGGMCKIYNPSGELIGTGSKTGQLYSLNCVPIMPPAPAADHAFLTTATTISSSRHALDINLWHRRLAHCGESRVRKLFRKKMVRGAKLADGELQPCLGCAKGKHKRQPFPTSTTRASRTGEVLHCDLQGPFEDASLGGKYYAMVVIDDFSRYSFKRFLRKKDEAPKLIDELITYIETQTGHQVKTFHSDNGGEFINSTMDAFFRSKGIRHDTSSPNTPE